MTEPNKIVAVVIHDDGEIHLREDVAKDAKRIRFATDTYQRILFYAGERYWGRCPPWRAHPSGARQLAVYVHPTIGRDEARDILGRHGWFRD